MRWGRDQEERQAVAQKAQDAYAAARSASARADGAAAAVDGMQAEIAALHRVVTHLALRVDELERVPEAPKRVRKVA